MPSDCLRYIWFIDLASKEPKRGRGRQPDFTCATFMGLKGGRVYIGPVVRFQGTPATNESVLLRVVNQTIEDHGINRIEVFMEQEPGSSGVYTIDHFKRGIFLGYIFKGVASSGSKVLRAHPFSQGAENGLIVLVEGENSGWIRGWLDEVEAFPAGSFDDRVDSGSGGFSQLVRTKSRPYASIGSKRGRYQ